MLLKIVQKYRSSGLTGLGLALHRRLFPPKIRAYSMVKEMVSQGKGFEIGGVSSVFGDRGVVPIYRHISSLDNCNFAHTTLWEGDLTHRHTYTYHPSRPMGQQYIREATHLEGIPDQHYDFVLSSHMLEHTANPIKALREWLRITKAGGYLIIILPHKEGTFDHRRPTTPLEHLIDDDRRDVDEDDLTHLDEILQLHDLSLDPGGGTHDAFAQRSQRNHENRCLHHHTFTAYSAAELMDQGLKIHLVESIAPIHIVIAVQKQEHSNNRAIFEFIRSQKYISPFVSDHLM